MISSLPKPLQNDFDTIVIDILSRYSLENKAVKRFVESVAQQVRDLTRTPRFLKQVKASNGKEQKDNEIKNDEQVTGKSTISTRLEKYQNAYNKGSLLGVFLEFLKSRQTQNVAKTVPSEQTFKNYTAKEKDSTPIAQTVKSERNVNNNFQQNDNSKTNILEKIVNNLNKVEEIFSGKGALGISKNIINYFRDIKASKVTPPPVTTTSYTTPTENISNITTPVYGASTTNYSTVNANNTTVKSNDSIGVTSGEAQSQVEDLLKDEQVVVLGGINEDGADDLTKIIKAIFEDLVPEERGVPVEQKDKSPLVTDKDANLFDAAADLGLAAMGLTGATGLLGKIFGKKGIIRKPLRDKKAAQLKAERAAARAAKTGAPISTTQTKTQVKPPTVGTPKAPTTSTTTQGSAKVAQAAGTKTATKSLGRSIAKRVPVLGTLLTAAFLASELQETAELEEAGEISEDEAKKQKAGAWGGAGGGLAGAAGGAAAGAALGTLILPGVGTVIGGILGGVAGGVGGEMLGRAGGESLASEPESSEQLAQTIKDETLKEETKTKQTTDKKDKKPELSKDIAKQKVGEITNETTKVLSPEIAKVAETATPLSPTTTKASSPVPGSVNETHITNNTPDKKLLTDIANNTEKTNKSISSLGDAVFQLARIFDSKQASGNSILINNNGQVQEYTSTAQMAANNVDSIRGVRQQFLAAT